MHLARRVVLLLLLGLCLGAPVATASGSRAPASPGTEESAPRGALVLLERLQGFLAVVWAKTGCAIDPWGRCSPEPAATVPAPPPAGGGSQTVAADDGCAIDPWGACTRNR